MTSKKMVLILGGGIGGLAVANKLSEWFDFFMFGTFGG